MPDDNDEVLHSKEMNGEESRNAREKTVFTDKKKMQFYEDLRNRVKKLSGKNGKPGGKFSEYVLLLPDFFILVCRLSVDDRVSNKKKLFLGGILAYLIMPIDIIPDFIPLIGHVDDLVLVVLGMNMLLNDIDKEILLDNWSGEEDLLTALQKISMTAEQFLDKNIISKIKNWLSKKNDT